MVDYIEVGKLYELQNHSVRSMIFNTKKICEFKYHGYHRL